MGADLLNFAKKAIFIVFLLFLLDLGIGKVLENNNGNLSTSYTIKESEADLFIFGTSKALHQYIPGIFEDELHLTAYNAGGDGQSILYCYALLKAISSRIVPEVVILDVRPYEFYEKELDYDRLTYLLPYYNYHPAIKEVVNLRGPFERIKSWSYLYRYNAFILDIMTSAFHPRDSVSKGFIPVYGTYEAKNENEPVPVEEAAGTPGKRKIDRIKINYFQRFVREAKQQGSQVFVFVSPLYTHSVYAETMNIINEICEQENVFFKDLSQDTAYLQKTVYFSDPGHLNKQGAEIYTRQIVQLIKDRINTREQKN